jgi:hypothetical protein
MIKVFLFIVYGVLFFPFSSNGEISLTATQTKIQIGESTEISWKITHGSGAYLSGFGKVPLEGKRTVKLDKSTRYILVAECPFGTVAESIEIKVEGLRGTTSLPSPDQFLYPRNDKIKHPSFTELLGQVHQILQDEMKFSLSENHPSNEQHSFTTYVSVRPELVKTGETALRTRQISFYVQVDKIANKTNEISVTVKSFIEYQRRSENTFRIERDESIYQEQASSLLAKIKRLNH